MSYTFLDHTADVLVEVRAATIEGVLQSSAQALYAIALKTIPEGPTEIRELSLKGETHARLLVTWLQELLFLLDTESFVAKDFTTLNLQEDCGLTACLQGVRCAAEDRADEIKSTTYHELSLERAEGQYVARFIFDL